MQRSTAKILSALLFVGLLGCTHKKPSFVYMPDMMYSPAFKAQEEGKYIMKAPVAGTVPRGFQPYAYAKDPEAAGRELRNPLRPTAAILARGQAMYNVYCIVCHGPEGQGDGTIVPKFPRPPSLQSEKVRKWPDGSIFHVATAGQNLMPSYASQIDAADRWAIVHYVRALQRAKHPTAEDIKSANAK